MTIGAEGMVTWGTWEELVLGGTVLRHGTQDWTLVATDLKTRTVSPCNFTPETGTGPFLWIVCETTIVTPKTYVRVLDFATKATCFVENGVCKAKYEELQQQYAGCTSWFEELRKKRVAELKRGLEQSEESIGSLELRLESLKAERNEKRDDCRVGNGSVEPELHVPPQKWDRVESSSKEMSKDGLSAGSFTHETQINWSYNYLVPTMSCEDMQMKPEVSLFTEPENVLIIDKLAHTVYGEQGVCLKKLRGKRKRRDCGRNIVIESDFSADVCKESSTSNCGEIVKSSGMNEENANLEKDGTKDLMEILDSVMEVRGASVFCRKLDSQKRGRYKQIILHHMDFDTIRSRISKKIFRSERLLFRDLLLLANNALVFYTESTREHKTALLIRDHVTKTMTEKLKCLSSRVTLANSSTTTTSPVHDPSVEVKSMRPGNHKIVAKVAGGSSSAERVSLGAKKANKVDSPPSVESLPIKKKAFGGTEKVGRESADQNLITKSIIQYWWPRTSEYIFDLKAKFFAPRIQ
ncbi:hypothetical protein CR513_56098, partial [Mucuna pruriens]